MKSTKTPKYEIHQGCWRFHQKEVGWSYDLHLTEYHSHPPLYSYPISRDKALMRHANGKASFRLFLILLLLSDTSFAFPNLMRSYINRIVTNKSSKSDEPWNIFQPNKPSLAPNQGFRNAIDYNWKYGLCKHRVSFEVRGNLILTSVCKSFFFTQLSAFLNQAATTIRKLRFCGDLCSVGFLDGKVCLIRLSTGDILDKFSDHITEISEICLHLAWNCAQNIYFSMYSCHWIWWGIFVFWGFSWKY